jgi:hypothetical protein
MYMTAVDRLLCHPDDKPTLGLLLVREKNRVLVEYALGGNTNPISVAEWDTRLTHALPEELQASLPTIEQIEAELAGVAEPDITARRAKSPAKGDRSAKRAGGNVRPQGRRLRMMELSDNRPISAPSHRRVMNRDNDQKP